VVTISALLGHRARRPLSAGHPVEADDVAGDAPADILIHASDLVHLIAQVGSMQVKTRGEALQAGHAGQLIQVRNLESKAIVTGRVVNRSTVEVDY
jgi:flagella basal body P-ring formation protein FlgA